MDIAEVKKLYIYNDRANARILQTAEQISAAQLIPPTTHSDGNLRNTLIHTLNAKWPWRVRWQGVSPPESRLQPGLPSARRWTGILTLSCLSVNRAETFYVDLPIESQQNRDEESGADTNALTLVSVPAWFICSLGALRCCYPKLFNARVRLDDKCAARQCIGANFTRIKAAYKVAGHPAIQPRVGRFG